MKTIDLLIQLHGALPIIPIEKVAQDHFMPLTAEKLIEKIRKREIALPLAQMGKSQKAMKGVPINALAKYLDDRITEANRDCNQLNGTQY